MFKSRHIPITELYSNLQMEYISYFVRSKIYFNDFSKNYSKICQQKKEKIDNISSRNHLPSIFNNESIRDKYVQKFLGDFGFPNFSYKDSVVKEKMQKWDRFYYFGSGVSVVFKEDDIPQLGVIVSNDKDLCLAVVKDEFGVETDLHHSNLKRIFPESFWSEF